MHKRGQITVFVILGILIIVVLAVIFYLYDLRISPLQQEQPELDFSRTEVLKNYVEGCIEEAGDKAINFVGKQGGEIQPGFYQNWNCIEPGRCDHVSYLCYTTENAACYNKKPFLKSFVENEINTYVSRQISSCINLDNLRNQGYNVQAGNMKLTTQVNDYTTTITLDYPITLTKGDASVQQNKFTKTFNKPLGRLIRVAEDIVRMEVLSPQGYVLYQSYVLSQNGEIQLTHDTYGSTEIYVAGIRNNPYKFQFAIQNYVTPFP